MEVLDEIQESTVTITEQPRVEVRQVSHIFNSLGGEEVVALDDVSFAVGDKEFVSVIGPSGCGKTTVLNMIAGLTFPTVGAVMVDGESVDGPQAGKVSYMFANDALFPWRTARDNVNLAMEMGGSKPPAGRADELLGLVGLRGFEKHYPSQLSQGMKQRVALARTLAVDASLWLMDEPFAALDAHTRTLIQDEFSRVWERAQKTAILVTHDLNEAVLLSDRVIVMSSRPGTIKAIYDIDLPRPRRIADLQQDSAFLALYAQLWSDLKEEFTNPTEET